MRARATARRRPGWRLLLSGPELGLGIGIGQGQPKARDLLEEFFALGLVPLGHREETLT